MKFPKWILFLALATAAALTLAGCMANQGDAQPTPVPTAEYDPGVGATPGAQTGAERGAVSAPAGDVNGSGEPAAPFDWSTRVGEIEKQIATLSEIAEDRVVVSGTTALVGVKFASEYQGEMTQRIRDMVAAEVMSADSAIRTVAVTSEQSDVTEIYEMSDRVAGGEDVNGMQTDVERIVRNATTLK